MSRRWTGLGRAGYQAVLAPTGMENGKRTDLPLKGEGRTYGKKAAVPSGTWSTFGVKVKGDLFTVVLNGTTLFEVEDRTFPGPGQVGLWTKADSVIRFDDLKIATD